MLIIVGITAIPVLHHLSILGVSDSIAHEFIVDPIIDLTIVIDLVLSVDVSTSGLKVDDVIFFNEEVFHE
jgi:hypothetical protein